MKWLFSALLVTSHLHLVVAFQSIAPPLRRTSAPRRSLAVLFDSESPPQWEKELEDTKVALGRIDALKALLEEEDTDTTPVNLEDLSDDLEQLEDEIGRLGLILPPGLSMPDFAVSLRAFSTLPLSLKLGMYIALGMNSDTESPYPRLAQYPEIVSRMYEDRNKLTVQKLEDGVKEAENRLKNWRSTAPLLSSGGGLVGDGGDSDMETEEILKQLLDGKSIDQTQSDNVVKQQLGRVTRKEGQGATPADLETLMGVLGGSNLFVVRGAPEEIPGGYVIRGANRKQSPKDLIEALDAKLPSPWNAQVSYFPDITQIGGDQDEADPVLVLLNKDFSAESSWVLPLSAGVAAVTTFLYGISAYEKTSVVGDAADRSALASGTVMDLLNNNQHLLEILAPLFVIQVLHELGHFLVAQNAKIDTSLPALIPFYDKLPNLGSRTNLKSSPPNLTSLFDFAFTGTFMGTLTSLICLAYGVQATLLADPQTLATFPSMTVEELKLSTLGSGIVDFLFGGSGVITSQDPQTIVQLHPFAVAGFSGLVIQALELLPLGSTDGGRMSQAVFGRSGHLVVGGAAWIGLLVATLFLDQSSDILLGAWAVNNVCQNDMEVPCREEVTKVDLYRSLAGFGLWFVAALTLVPLQ